MKRTNFIYKFYNDYIMNKYCIILYIFLILLVMRYDSYTSVLLFILIIVPFKFVYKEYFKNFEYFQTTISQTTIPKTNILYSNTIPQTTQQYIMQLGTDKVTQSILIDSEYLDIDDRFKIDKIKKNEILKQIKAQIDNDPYKTNLSKDVINEIYGKYFDNDIFIKLKKVNDDSQKYIASGNFPYLPKDNKVDYDLVTYQNLSNNTQLGINPISDGIKTPRKTT